MTTMTTINSIADIDAVMEDVALTNSTSAVEDGAASLHNGFVIIEQISEKWT